MTQPRIPADYHAWRQSRWEEIAGTNGKGAVIAKAAVNGRGHTPCPACPASGPPPGQER